MQAVTLAGEAARPTVFVLNDKFLTLNPVNYFAPTGDRGDEWAPGAGRHAG